MKVPYVHLPNKAKINKNKTILIYLLVATLLLFLLTLAFIALFKPTDLRNAGYILGGMVIACAIYTGKLSYELSGGITSSIIIGYFCLIPLVLVIADVILIARANKFTVGFIGYSTEEIGGEVKESMPEITDDNINKYIEKLNSYKKWSKKCFNECKLVSFSEILTQYFWLQFNMFLKFFISLNNNKLCRIFILFGEIFTRKRFYGGENG